MAFSHTLMQKIATAGNTILKSNAYSGGSQTSIDESIADSETDLEVAFTLDDTIVLVAGVPYVWHTGSYFVNILTGHYCAIHDECQRNVGQVAD